MSRSQVELSLLIKAKNLASKELDKVKGSLGGVTQKAKALGGGLVSLAKYAALGFGAVVAGVALAAPAVMDMGAQLELMDKKAQTVFGDQLDTVKTWAKTNAEAMGLTQTKATGLAANFADLLIPMKFTREEATKMATDVVGLSGALSEWSGGQRSAEEVSQILAKAMLGERDALKELGISITEADVDQRLMQKGQEKLTGAQLEQAKATATQELIFEKSTDAQAAYEKGGGTLARQQAKLRAKFDELVESAVRRLMPILTTVMKFIMEKLVPAVGDVIGKIEEWFRKNKPLVDQITKFVSGVLTTMFQIIGNIVGAIGFLIGAIANSKPAMAFLRKAVQLIADAMGILMKLIGRVIDGIRDIIGFARDAIGWVQDLIGENKEATRTAPYTPGAFGHAAGGWVGLHGPELGLLGERGPEYIIPNHELRGGRGAGGGGAPAIINLVVDGRTLARIVDERLYYAARRAPVTPSRVG